jgi:hypothetical protein
MTNHMLKRKGEVRKCLGCKIADSKKKENCIIGPIAVQNVQVCDATGVK